MTERNNELKSQAENVAKDPAKIKELVDILESAPRRDRQSAASVLKHVARHKPEALVPHMESMIEALNRPEAQTRWESLEALSMLVEHDSRTCGKALAHAETALFDEESGPVRLAAMRFLCKYGGTTTARSDKAWPLIDEGIQCYHGDTEFNDMLVAIIEFSDGKLSDEVKKSLHARMAFDASNAKGSLQRKAQQILNNLK